MTRITRDQLYMQISVVISQRSTCPRNAVGAVIVRDGRITGMGYNASAPGDDHCLDVGCDIGPDGGCVRAIHAELNAVAYMAKAGISTDGTTLYVTLSPCSHCSKIILAAGIKEVVYLSEYRIRESIEFLRRHKIRTRHLSGDTGRPNTPTTTVDQMVSDIKRSVAGRKISS